MIDHLAVLEAKGAAFVGVIRGGDLDAPVEGCPGWALRDLALHQGRVWLWARSCIESGAPADESEEEIADQDLAEWLELQRNALVSVLRSTDPGAPTWTFGPPPRTVAFWHRRQAHEVTVHLWDAQAAVGEPDPIADDLAADGVAEVFEVFLPRQVRLERMAAVVDGVRIVLPNGRHFDLGSPIVSAAAGSPADVLLALWRRVPLDRLRIAGDAGAAHRAFNRALTP